MKNRTALVALIGGAVVLTAAEVLYAPIRTNVSNFLANRRHTRYMRNHFGMR